LKEVKGKEIKTDPSKQTNILIEGDNYHALSVLNYTHQGKIDVIYIDPPYNTGNKSWKYNNSYVELDDSFKHSKWLSFMSKKTKISENLLSEDGIICVTIDDHELPRIWMCSKKSMVKKII
jgi:adenine-specific DNA-methyltransferase